jgi:glycerol-3-phosphate acyltransferase PlsY
VIALVEGLVEWLPTNADWAGYVAGPLVVLGYLAGTLPQTWVRRRLDRPVADHPRWLEAAGAAAAAGVAVLAATVAWDVGKETAPPGQISAVATYSNQAIGAWASMALWTGAGAVVGSVAPVWDRFRGGSGVVPAAALAALYAPVALVAGGAAAVVAGGRRRALAAALVAAVAGVWLAWVTDTQLVWGVTNGPELGLWTVALAGVLAARNLGGRPARQ